MVALASSKEEVIEKLKADIYSKNEVWDFSKVSLRIWKSFSEEMLMTSVQIQIYPFKCAFRNP